MRKTVGIALMGLIVVVAVGAVDFYAQGEELFMRNKPLEAIVLLEQAIKADPTNEQAYLYLAISYIQTKQPVKAIAILQKGLAYAVSKRDQFLYNMGNAYSSQANYNFAEDFYGQAIDANQGLSAAYLNRGNARVYLKKYNEAISDYTMYLSLEPNSPKKIAVQKMIDALTSQLADIQKANDAKAAAAKAEADAKQAIVDAAIKSLDDAADETTNMAAGAEDTQGYDDEFQLAP